MRDLPDYLGPTDLLVFNQTKVLPALLSATRRDTGGKVQGLNLGSEGTMWRVMLESRGTLRPGERITLRDDASLVLRTRVGGEEADQLPL